MPTQGKYVPPAVSELAFNCPHCGALAKQFWFSVHATDLAKDRTPMILDPKRVEDFDGNDPADRVVRELAARFAKGRPFIDESSQYHSHDLRNVSLSRCFNCDDVALWIYDRLVWPRLSEAPAANVDLPKEVRGDYDEAGTVLGLSARGAAALLRLAIQKLCVQLGEKGKNLDDDIASLVRKGLDVRVQQALDVVRVIGNNAVHPGQIDLQDDQSTATKLFGLVNLITERMISEPKHVSEMFNSLPEGALKAIEKRDQQKPTGDVKP